MTRYALKDEAFQRLKKRIEKFCAVHHEGGDIQYAGHTFDIDACDLKGDNFRIKFDNPKVGLFEFRTLFKEGEFHLLETDDRGHSRSEIEAAWEVLGIPIERENVVCIKDKGVMYCPVEKYYYASSGEEEL